MKKAVALICLVSLMLAGVAMATPTRVATMGGAGNVMKDESAVEMWPQAILAYPDLGTIEINTVSIYSAGSNMKMGPGVLGCYSSNQPWDIAALSGQTLNGASYALDRKIQLIYGWDLSGNPFGVSFGFYGKGQENKNAAAGSATGTYSGMGLKIGAGITLMQNLDIAFEFDNQSFEIKDAAEKKVASNDGGTSIMLMARYWHEISAKETVIPHFAFVTTGGGTKFEAGAGTSNKTGETEIDLGVGDNMKLTDGAWMVSDIGVKFVSGSDEPDGGKKVETGSNYLPYLKGGMEAAISPTWTFRFGTVTTWNSNSWKRDNEEHNTSGASTAFYLGSGWKHGPFEFDAAVNPGFLTNGPFVLTGIGSRMFTSVSLLYTWGK